MQMRTDISKWGLANKRIVWLFTVLLTVGGVISYYRMPKLEDPEIVVRQALVVGLYPGASAHQVELELTTPLENSINQTSDILFTESYSYADMCYVMVTQDTKVPQDKLHSNWVKMRNNIADASLPQGAQVVVKDDFGSMSGLFYALKGDGVTPDRLQSFAEMICRELQKIEGVSNITVYGTQQQRVSVKLHQDRLANMDITPAEVIATLNGQDATVYAGYYLNGDYRIRVSVDDRYNSLDDIRTLILQGHNGEKFRLGDIADISMEPERPVRAEMLRDGQLALGLLISSDSGTDIIKVGAKVEQKINQLKATRLPSSIECEKVFFQSDRVSDAMHTFILNLTGSVLLVILLLMLCMNFRSGLILGATLIVTVLGTVFILEKTGGTLQRVSLGSFILAMGMLVDNAIVVIDGMLVKGETGPMDDECLSSVGRKAAKPLLGATLIAILAFLPIFLSPDVTGLYVHDMFIVLAVSLLLSWLLALVLVPIMGSFLFKRRKPVPEKADAPYSGRAYRWLASALRWGIGHRWLTVGLMSLLLVAAALSFNLMPRVLFPDLKYDQLYMEYKLPESNNYTRVRNDLENIRQELMKMDDITHVTTSIGGTPGRYNLVRSVAMPSLSYGELIIDFKSARALERNIDELQSRFSALYPDAYLLFKRYNLMFMHYPVELRFCGPDPAILHQLADSALDVAKRLNVLNPVTTDWGPRVPMLVADYDQARAREHGVSRTEVAVSLLAATDGIPAGSYYDGIKRHSIYVSTSDPDGNILADLNNATISTLLPRVEYSDTWNNIASLLISMPSLRLSHSSQIREIGDAISLEWEEPVIPHYNGERIQSISGTASYPYTTEQARSLLAAEIESWELPDGYSINWGGEKYASDLSMKNLFAPYPLVIILMLAILVAITRRFRTSLLLFCSIPFIFLGIIPAILMSGSTFNFVAIVGMLGLVGMILKNGIVLVDEITLRLQSSQTPSEAIIQASVSRLRPVTMASLTTVFGMIPLLFDDMFSAMAATITGGLLVGTVIVLFLIPVLYSLFFKTR